ncbi:hypothetical protein GL218_07218 [Daldinia childiae]|uniref:uncharacterized protein n=1 Tax=Daldinia childiae TaxID=326645 RepID=UPI0014488F9C|nr:uncharacterized protein GL218_07218 [Daldinia childiae]KAF3055805.1 hypothetical protein GL218_07218 [Daldinia childiae]
MRVDLQEELDEVMSLDESTSHDESMGLDEVTSVDHMDLSQQSDIDSMPETATAPSSFPQFNSLPQHVRRMIWKHAMDEELGAHHIVVSNHRSVCRSVPALAHACRMSRSIAFEKGGVFKLGNGDRTWFCPATDFVYWDTDKYDLGELTSSVQNLIVPFFAGNNFNEVFHHFSEKFEAFFVPGNPSQLKNIFISVEWAATTDIWSDMAISRLFGSRTILAPALDQFDPLIDHVNDTCPVLPGLVAEIWKKHEAIDFDQSVKWRKYAGEVLHAWMNTAAVFSNKISGDQLDDFWKERLMHPNGGSWLKWFEDRAPNIFPTFMFTKPDDDEIVMT